LRFRRGPGIRGTGRRRRDGQALAGPRRHLHRPRQRRHHLRPDPRPARGDQLPSFEAAIQAGVDQVMVTHIVMPNVDPSGVPSSLSPTIVGLLRNQLGFQGPIITDAMNAQALAAYTPADAAIMAINAGEDQLLYAQQQPMTGQPQYFIEAYNAVLDAVNNSQI